MPDWSKRMKEAWTAAPRPAGSAGRCHEKAAFAAALAIAAGVTLHQGSTAADVLDTIEARGTLIVGTKADYRPFGYRDASGAIVGFEPDLAKEVAKKLGVKVELVPVVASNRILLLTEG